MCIAQPQCGHECMLMLPPLVMACVCTCTHLLMEFVNSGTFGDPLPIVLAPHTCTPPPPVTSPAHSRCTCKTPLCLHQLAKVRGREGAEALVGQRLPAGAVAVSSGPLPTPAPTHRTRTSSAQKGCAVSSNVLSQYGMLAGECMCNVATNMVGENLPNRFCVSVA